MSVVTTYEVRVLTKLANEQRCEDFASVERFDELEFSQAKAGYYDEKGKAAAAIVGKDHSMTTEAGAVVGGRVVRVLVELVARKVGEWVSQPYHVHDPDGEPMAVFFEAPEPEDVAEQRKALTGRTCSHGRWIARWMTDHDHWHEVWGAELERASAGGEDRR